MDEGTRDAAAAELVGGGGGIYSLLAALLFGLVSGSCDASSFLGLHQILVANITGDLVLIGADWAARLQREEVGRVLTLPVFVLVVWLGRLLAGWVRNRGLPARRTLILLMVVFLAAFFALAVTQGPFPSQDAPNTLMVALIGVAAMALLNVVARLWPALAQGSTAMTGNTVKLLADIAELMLGEHGKEPGLLHDSGRLAFSVAMFVAGAALAALVYANAGMWCTALPLFFGLCMLPTAPTDPSPASPVNSRAPVATVRRS